MNGEKFVFNNITNNYYQIQTSEALGHAGSPITKVNENIYTKQCGGFYNDWYNHQSNNKSSFKYNQASPDFHSGFKI